MEMHPSKNRKILAISLGVIIYISIMSIFFIQDGKELKEAIFQALCSAVLSGAILWGLLKVINRKKRIV